MGQLLSSPASPHRKPLTYQSSKCVLQHMEANRRIFLAARCPSLRNLHRCVPFKIENLIITDTSVKINNYWHYFSSFILHPESGAVIHEAPYDVDAYGNREMHFSTSLKESDFRTEYIIHRLDMNPSRPYKPTPQFTTEHPSVVKFYLIGTEDRPVTYITFPYGTKIRDALRKHLKNVLVGNRDTIIKRFEIEPDDFVVRLPSDLRLTVQNLRTLYTCKTWLRVFRSIMASASFPLKSVTVASGETNGRLIRSKLLKTAEVLYLEISFLPPEYFKLMGNKEIHCSGFISHRMLIQSAKHWTENCKEIGSKRTFLLEDTDYLEETKAAVNGKWGLLKNIRTKSPYCVVRQQGVNELVIYDQDSPVTPRMDGMQRRQFVMEVMSAGTVEYVD